jgi:hypothetical protein
MQKDVGQARGVGTEREVSSQSRRKNQQSVEVQFSKLTLFALIDLRHASADLLVRKKKQTGGGHLFQISFFSTLTTCLESNTNPNYKIVKPVDHNVTTEEPVYDEPLVTENYADYVDFNDEYYKNMEYVSANLSFPINSTENLVERVHFQHRQLLRSFCESNSDDHCDRRTLHRIFWA